jgi:AcrR family transcriptional regulator
MAQITKIDSRTALLDAAERLMIERGYGALTVRVVATEAGVNHGLVRYYFDTLDVLLLEAFTRFSDRLFERQRALYEGEGPFIDKWRVAMGYLEDEDRETGYSKLWLEMQAMAWNRPDLQARLKEVNSGWRAILVDAIGGAMAGYGLDTDRFAVDAVVSLVMTFNLGIHIEAAGGVTDGHEALLAMIDRILVDLESNRKVELS